MYVPVPFKPFQSLSLGQRLHGGGGGGGWGKPQSPQSKKKYQHNIFTRAVRTIKLISNQITVMYEYICADSSISEIQIHLNCAHLV